MVTVSWKVVQRSFFWVGLILVGVLVVSAQGTATPIGIGQNISGQLTDPTATVQYSVSVAAPQSINIQVLAISSGFAPTFQVLDPGGIVIVDTANPGTQTIAQASPSLSSPGTYIIEIKSANNAAGQFLVSVQPGAPLAPPTPLTPGQPIDGTVSTQATRQAYSFSASPSDVLLLDVSSTTPDSGAVIALRDADSGETLALDSAKLGGARFRILTGQINYLLEVTNGGSDSEAFTVCLATESGSVTCPGSLSNSLPPTLTPVPQEIVPTDTPTLFFLPTPTLLIQPTVGFSPVVIDPNGSCQVASAQNQFVNIRSGPSTNDNVLGQLPPTATALVLGRLADNSWFQVNYNGLLGWISATVVIVGGNCTGVTVVMPPTAIPPTDTPTEAPTDTPTATPTEEPSNTPGGPTNTPRFHLQPTLVFHFPTATPTHIHLQITPIHRP